MLESNTKYQSIRFRAPSNIAFIKYWGKFGRQLPMNPSISMTLKNCFTETKVDYRLNEVSSGLKEFRFDGVINENFAKRIKLFTESITDQLPILSKIEFNVDSYNSFPHSAGIASSASAMAALSACLVDIQVKHSKQLSLDTDDYFQKVSVISRLGSGSACRSIYADFAIWGESRLDINSSNEFAIKAQNIHENFSELCDAIIIVSSDEKEVSSSLGHSLMNTHLYKEVREYQAHENLRSILNAMKIGDYEQFGEILENEALTLHALMMTSYPSFILLRPNSLLIIEKVKKFRKDTQTPVYFTIDAGPNIHLIYPKKFKEKVHNFITSELSSCSEQVLYDEVGIGIQRL